MLITVFEGCLHLVVVGFNSHSNCIAIRVNPMIFMNLSFQKISMLAVTSIHLFNQNRIKHSQCIMVDRVLVSFVSL